MQISLCENETIIKLNSKNTNINFVLHFINGCFEDITIKNNQITIPKKNKNKHHRIFLLKWMYAMYLKKTKKTHINLKNLLANIDKNSIKIVFDQKLSYKLKYNFIEEKEVSISIIPYNVLILNYLRKYFNIKKNNSIDKINISINSKEEIKLLEKLLTKKSIITFHCEHIYDRSIMYKTLKYTRQTEIYNHIDNAFATLGIKHFCDLEMLKKQYRLLAKKYHPDMIDSNDSSTLQYYSRKFQNITQAYQVLKKVV